LSALFRIVQARQGDEHRIERADPSYA